MLAATLVLSVLPTTILPSVSAVEEETVVEEETEHVEEQEVTTQRQTQEIEQEQEASVGQEAEDLIDEILGGTEDDDVDVEAILQAFGAIT